MQEPFKVNLYKSHFTIQDNETTHQYHGPLKCLIDGINRLEIPPELSQYLGDHFESGRLKVQVTDYRYEPSITKKLYLEPTSESILADVEQLKTVEWTEDFKNHIEAQILVNTFQLNLNPSPAAAIINTQREYNTRKYNLKRKRVSNFDDKQVEETKRKESAKLMLLMDKSKDVAFYPRFSQLAFVEDWRQKQKMASEEQLIGLGDKNKIKINVQGISNRIYSILNVYELDGGQYEGVLRWGTQEGTAIDGDTIRFPLGNKPAVDYYIAHFKGFYGIIHKLISDSAMQPGQ